MPEQFKSFHHYEMDRLMVPLDRTVHGTCLNARKMTMWCSRFHNTVVIVIEHLIFPVGLYRVSRF